MEAYSVHTVHIQTFKKLESIRAQRMKINRINAARFDHWFGCEILVNFYLSRNFHSTCQL